MINGQRVVVVLPAYNAARTLERTIREIDRQVVDHVILVDDASSDETALLAAQAGVQVHVHERNLGYGGNQKTCYRLALGAGADIVVMLHPDYQYTPKLVSALAAMIAYGEYDIVLASRILGRGALKGGMPLYKYLANRFLTLAENIILGLKLSEYHTGYRGFSRVVLEALPLEANANTFVFDNQVIVQAHAAGFTIGEISCPTRYQEESSSIGFWQSVYYGLGVLGTALAFRAHRWGLAHAAFLSQTPNRSRPPSQSRATSDQL